MTEPPSSNQIGHPLHLSVLSVLSVRAVCATSLLACTCALAACQPDAAGSTAANVAPTVTTDEPAPNSPTPSADGVPTDEVLKDDAITVTSLYGLWRVDVPASVALAPEQFAATDASNMERRQFRVRLDPNGTLSLGPTRDLAGNTMQPSSGSFRDAVVTDRTITFDTTSPAGQNVISVVFGDPDTLTLTLPGGRPRMVLVRVPASE
jgi:hypothetical protein